MQIQRILTVCLSLLVGATAAQAQNPFAPVIEVNEDVITQYELDQRQRFLRVISPANAGSETVREELINDKLRRQAIQRLGLELTDAEIEEGMVEFAGRANLTVDEFLQALGQRGVERQTFRDFVAVGIAWRDLVRARYGSRVEISEAEVDRALNATAAGSGVRVLLSEIILPAPPPQQEAVLARAERIAQSTTEAEFSSFARRFSATASRERGGRLNWTPLSQLPATLRPLILALGPGEVTQPIPIPNAVALFQLRAIEETGDPSPSYNAIEYAQFLIPGGRSEAALSEAARIRARVDVCDDLYGIAKDLPEERLLRDTKAPAEIPQDIALELAKLDRDEVSTALTTRDGQALIFLMLCGRTVDTGQDVSRDAVAARLRQERLAGLAENLLEELRADARIRIK